MKAPRGGQSITELLLAIAVGAIFVVASVAVIVPALRESNQAGYVQEGVTVAQSLLSSARVWAASGWGSVAALSTGTAYQYYIITSSTPYVATSGVQTVVIGTTTYTAYFYLSDAYRSAGNIGSGGGTYDPATKQISVVYNWTHGVTGTISTYFTRNGDKVIDQTDWSGGSNASSVVTSAGSQFGTSSNIDYSTATGELYVAIPGY